MAQNRGTSTGRVEQPRAARAPVPLRPRLEGAARGSARQRGSRTHGLRELRAARDGKAATGPPGASPQRLKGKCLRRTAGAPLSALPLQHRAPSPAARPRGAAPPARSHPPLPVPNGRFQRSPPRARRAHAHPHARTAPARPGRSSPPAALGRTTPHDCRSAEAAALRMRGPSPAPSGRQGAGRVCEAGGWAQAARERPQSAHPQGSRTARTGVLPQGSACAAPLLFPRKTRSVPSKLLSYSSAGGSQQSQADVFTGVCVCVTHPCREAWQQAEGRHPDPPFSLRLPRFSSREAFPSWAATEVN